MAGFARAERAVEGERARLELRNAGAAVGTGELLRVELFFAIDDGDDHQSVGQLGGGFDGRFERFSMPGLSGRRSTTTSMVWFLRRSSGISSSSERSDAVDAGAHEALARELFQILLVFAFAAAHDGRQDHDALALRERQDLLQDLLGALARDFDAAGGAVRDADGGVEHAQVVVNFGDGADGGARAAVGGFLLDGDGGAEAVDGIDFGALHLIEELARVGGERFDVAALALGVDGVEGERGFAGAAESGDDGEGVAGDLDVDIFEIVLAGAVHGDALEHFGWGSPILTVSDGLRRVSTPPPPRSVFNPLRRDRPTFLMLIVFLWGCAEVTTLPLLTCTHCLASQS